VNARTLALSALLVGCGGSAGADVDASADAGVDAPAIDTGPRDAGPPDGGFDAAVLGPCTLTPPPAFPLAPHTRVASGTSPSAELADRDFYVLTVLEQLPGVSVALAADAAVMPLASARESALRDADAHCGDAACVMADLVRADDAAAISATVDALGRAGHLTDVAAELRATHDYQRFVDAGQDDTALVTTALTEALANLDDAFGGFVVSELPFAMLAPIVHDVASAPAGSLAWWQPLLRVTTAAMIADHRDEAVRYEPLDTGENAAAIAAIATTDFSHYPYVAILVPGEGPTDLVTALNPVGAQRCDLAVARWQAGLAPFLLVSGGHVHPDRTMFSEAIEMKRYLLTTYGVPESAIIVDPYARHTTTNLRNTVRELFRYGAPTDGIVLIVSDRLQTIYIRDPSLATRCDAELHYRPFLGMQALTATDTCMTMAPASLTIAASDPRDP
jgi:hypothetical protein